jgi:HK97 family phage major capsid protein
MADGAIPPDVKKQLDDLMVSLKASRDTQAELDRQVKKLGEDTLTKEKGAKIDAAFDKIKDDINAIYKKVNRQAVAQTDAKVSDIEVKANLQVAKWIGKEGDAAAGAALRIGYKNAFDKLVRKGRDALSPEEIKTISVGSAPDGGFYVEPARDGTIVTRLRETSAMRSIATIMTVGNPSYKFNIDRDDVGYGWVGEQSSRPETDTPQFGEGEIPVHEMYALPKETQNALDDLEIDMEAQLNDKIVDRLGRAENTAFCTGNAVKQPQGFLTPTPSSTADASRAFGTLQYIATGVSGGFATIAPADKLLDLIHEFNAGYRKNLQWAGSKRTLGAIRKFKDDNDNYIYDASLSANGIIDMVLRYPWNEFADMSDYSTANAFGVALGDWKKGYRIVDKQGMRQLRDPYTQKGYVLFYTTKRVGGGLMDTDAIKLLKFGTS